MNLLSQLSRALIISAGLMLASSAHAGFVGQTITYSLNYAPTSTVLGSAQDVITNGTKLGPLYDDQLNATFTDNTILFGGEECCQYAPNLYFHIYGADLGIAKVSLNSAASTNPDISESRISFGPNDIWVNVGGMHLSSQNHFLLDVAFKSEGQGDVPEPASLTLFAAAAMALAVARRRRSTGR